MIFCQHCAFATFVVDAQDASHMVIGCTLRLPVIEGPHDCPMFEREPGCDDG
jgi:hypothetical protein